MFKQEDNISEEMELKTLYWYTTAGSSGNILGIIHSMQASSVQH